MAAAIMSQKEGRPVGVHRIWIDPDYLDEVISAVQKDGLISTQPPEGNDDQIGRAHV